MTAISENELLKYLQGHWEPETSGPRFEIVNRKVLVAGSIRGIGIPGLDNNVPMPLILKWNEDLKMWQIFVEELGWFQTFINEIAERYFTIRHYDSLTNELSEPISIKRNG